MLYINEIVNTIIAITAIIAMIMSVKAFKKDAGKDIIVNIEKTVNDKIHGVEELLALKHRVDLLEQLVGITNSEIKKDFREIKELISELFKRFNDHVEKHK